VRGNTLFFNCRLDELRQQVTAPKISTKGQDNSRSEIRSVLAHFGNRAELGHGNLFGQESGLTLAPHTSTKPRTASKTSPKADNDRVISSPRCCRFIGGRGVDVH